MQCACTLSSTSVRAAHSHQGARAAPAARPSARARSPTPTQRTKLEAHRDAPAALYPLTRARAIARP
eukprot:2959809-Prymnesium_polylepis.1